MMNQGTMFNSEQLQSKTFEDIQTSLKNVEFINAATVFLKSTFANNFTDQQTRVFLTSFILYEHASEITNGDVYSERLQQCAKSLINEMNYYIVVKTDKQKKTFFKEFFVYMNFFDIWKQRESMIMVRPVITSYHEIGLMRVQETDEERKRDYGLLQKKIKQNIYIIAGNAGIEMLESGKVPMFKDEKVFTDVEQTVRKAFWDVFHENIESNNFEAVYNLLEDLKQMMLYVAPEKNGKKLEVNAVFDMDLLKQVINEKMSHTDIFNLMTYVITFLKENQSASEDKSTELFEQALYSKIETQEKLSQLLVFFFKTSLSKMENIQMSKKNFLDNLKQHKTTQ